MESILKKLNDDHFNEVTKPINNIYIDLDCFLDHYLGALFYLLLERYPKEEAEQYKEKVLTQLDQYDTTTTIGDISVFDTPITNEEVSQLLLQPEAFPSIVMMSPRRVYYQAFFIFLNTIVATNRRSYASTAIELMVGARHPLPQEMKDTFIVSMQTLYPDIRTTTISDCRIYQFDKFLFSMFDHYTVENIQQFVDKHTEIFKEGNADYKSVHTFPYVFLDIGDKDVVDVLEDTELAAQLLYDFRYVHKTILRE